MRGQLVRLRPGIDRSALSFLPVAVGEHPGSSAICAGDSSFWHGPSIPRRARPDAALAGSLWVARSRCRPEPDAGAIGSEATMVAARVDRKSTRLNSSHVEISYA